MAEMIKITLQDLILFSLVEAFIYAKFFTDIGKCEKFKLYEIIFIGTINCLISTTIPPILYQFMMIVFMGCYISLKKNKTIVKSLFISLCSSILLMVIEMSFAILAQCLFNIDMMRIDDFTLFIYMIPLRFLELCIIDTIKEVIHMKSWLGEIVKRK